MHTHLFILISNCLYSSLADNLEATEVCSTKMMIVNKPSLHQLTLRTTPGVHSDFVYIWYPSLHWVDCKHFFIEPPNFETQVTDYEQVVYAATISEITMCNHLIRSNNEFQVEISQYGKFLKSFPNACFIHIYLLLGDKIISLSPSSIHYVHHKVIHRTYHIKYFDWKNTLPRKHQLRYYYDIHRSNFHQKNHMIVSPLLCNNHHL